MVEAHPRGTGCLGSTSSQSSWCGSRSFPGNVSGASGDGSLPGPAQPEKVPAVAAPSNSSPGPQLQDSRPVRARYSPGHEQGGEGHGRESQEGEPEDFQGHHQQEGSEGLGSRWPDEERLGRQVASGQPVPTPTRTPIRTMTKTSPLRRPARTRDRFAPGWRCRGQGLGPPSRQEGRMRPSSRRRPPERGCSTIPS